MPTPPLLSRLSPQAKKLVLRGHNQAVSALAEVAPTADLEEIRRAVEACHGRVRSSASPSLLSVEIDVRHLTELADLDGVVYVSTAETYRR